MKKIIFTGGGSAGHVTPNLALIDYFKNQHWQVDYIGSATGIEKQLITDIDIPYHAISCGKLRRYFSWQNFIMPLQVLKGIIQAFTLCLRLKPDVIFSKGGFVSLPVVIAAWMLRIPVLAHESDLTPGLANRLSYPFVKRIALGFAEAKKYFKNASKTLVSGTPIRPELLQGDKAAGLSLCGFSPDKPVLLVIGGSLGANVINQCLRQALPELMNKYQVIHLCGKDKLDVSLNDQAGYRQFEAVYGRDFADLLAAADYAISRAGANAIYELLSLAKLHILIPLSKKASRGDQIDNAKFCQQAGLSMVLAEEDLTVDTLLQKIEQLETNKAQFIKHLQDYAAQDSRQILIQQLEALAN